MVGRLQGRTAHIAQHSADDMALACDDGDDNRSGDLITAVDFFEDATPRQTVHFMLRPRMANIAKCVGSLNALLDDHPEVTVDLVGIGRDPKHLLLTLAVDAGPKTKIARPPRDGEIHEATNAFAFVAAVFNDLFDHLPTYTDAPSAEEQQVATTLPTIIGKGLGGQQAAPSPMLASVS